MGNEKNHLYSEHDEQKDRKNVNKRKEQQQFSRFSVALATSVNNATIEAVSPALQVETKPQIGFPYDDTKGDVATNQVLDFSTFGSQYTFYTATGDVVFTFTGLPTGRAIRFTIDILVDNLAGVNLSFPQVTDPPELSGNNGDRYVLTFVGVKRSDQTGQNPPVETYTLLSSVFTPTTGPTGNAVQGHIVKEVDDTVNNSNSLTNDSELRFTAEPNKVYFLELNTNFDSDTSADIKFGLDIPGGATYKLVDSPSAGSPWTPFTGVSNGQSISFDGGVIPRQTNSYYILEAGPTGGIVTVTFAQVSAQALDTKLLRGTLLRIFQGGVGGLPSGSIPPVGPIPPPFVITPLKGYAIGRKSEGNVTPSLRSLGGPASGQFGVPAMGAGKMKEIRTTIVDYPASGGNLKIQTYVNGVGPQLGAGMVGIVGTPTVHLRHGLDRPFVKDDIIGWQMTRSNGTGLMVFNTWVEIEYEETELWFYTATVNTVKEAFRYLALFPASANEDVNGPNSGTRAAHQTSLGQDGLIKDIVYFGTIVAGIGPAFFEVEVNGVVQFTSPDLTDGGQHIERFDDINVLVNANDLVNVRFIGRNPPPGPGATGLFGIRVVLL